MTRDQVLDELAALATVEHALIVEYLTVFSALGHELPPEESGASPAVQGAAFAFSSLAQGEMSHLHRVNELLVAAGRPAELARADKIAGADGTDIPLGPPTATQLQQLVERERAIAKALDARYRRLSSAVSTPAPDPSDELLAAVAGLADLVGGHASGVEAIVAPIASLLPGDLVRVSGRAAANDAQRRLLVLSDKLYASLLDLVDVWFIHDGDLAGQLRSPGISAMTALNGVNGELARRKLLPPFALP